MPIHKDESFECNLVPSKMHNHVEEEDDYELLPQLSTSVSITRNTTILDVKSRAIAANKTTDIRPTDLVAVTYARGKIKSYLKDTNKAFDVDSRSESVLLYHVPKETETSVRTECLFYKVITKNKKSYYEDIPKMLARLMYFEPDMTILQVKRKIYEKIRGVFKKPIEDDEELNTAIVVHLENNLPLMNITSKYYKERPPCEFTGKKLSP